MRFTELEELEDAPFMVAMAHENEYEQDPDF